MSNTGPRVINIRNTYITIPKKVHRSRQYKQTTLPLPSPPPPSTPLATAQSINLAAQISSYGSIALLVLSEALPFVDGVKGNGLIDILRKAVATANANANATKGPQTSSS